MGRRDSTLGGFCGGLQRLEGPGALAGAAVKQQGDRMRERTGKEGVARGGGGATCSGVVAI
jgi:hypothetical protein